MELVYDTILAVCYSNRTMIVTALYQFVAIVIPYKGDWYDTVLAALAIPYDGDWYDTVLAALAIQYHGDRLIRCSSYNGD